uniref:Secreted protein n=1 Tax=Arundo donax TaxID=35708 RepID=A0A0A9BN03_ARUDO
MKILSFALLLLVLLICMLYYFCWSRASKSHDSLPVRNVEIQHRQMPSEASPQMEQGQSGQLRGRRISSGLHSRHGSPNV